MARKITGIRRRRAGWEAYVRVHGELYTKQYPIDQPLADMRAWREQQIDAHGGRKGRSGSFAADVLEFLGKPEIAAQQYVGQLAHYLGLWIEALGGDRPRATITRDEIEAVLQRWLKTYAEPTVYHRRSALLQLFTVLDGAGAANPVKDTTCPKSWIPADHSTKFSTLAAIVDAMPDWRYPKKGIKQVSIAKLVGRVIVAIGIRPADLAQIRRGDFDRQAATLRWPASSKGKGVAARTVPLSTEGFLALSAFDEADAYGKFNPEAVSHSFKRAARRIDGKETPIHLYTGRHTLGADLYRETRDLATVGRMLNHAPGSRSTPQYAQGANADVDRAAAQALSAARQVHPAEQKLARKLAEPRKRQKTGALRRRA